MLITDCKQARLSWSEDWVGTTLLTTDFVLLQSARSKLEPPHYDGVQSLALKGNYLFSGSRDNSIKKWNIETQQLIQVFLLLFIIRAKIKWDHVKLVIDVRVSSIVQNDQNTLGSFIWRKHVESYIRQVVN